MTNTQNPRRSAQLRIERATERRGTLVVDGRAFSYEDIGTGPTVLLAHGSGHSQKTWASFRRELSVSYRVLTPELLGYGRSEPSPMTAPLHPWSDLGAVVALAELADGPVHLVGHSYGGAVTLEAARMLGSRVRSLTLIEPIAFHLLRIGGGIRSVGDYRAIDMPTRLIVGEHTPKPVRNIVNALVQILPDAHVRELAGAGHMSPVTHPADAGALVAEHIDSMEVAEGEVSATRPGARRSIA
jgi:pimeloyl-ACP methyl ester carboxylesterase